MRVDVQLNDDELALLSGYNRSTSMGIKKPGELQRELLSDMENIEEKRMVSVPEVENESEDSKDAAPVEVRADFLSMLSGFAKPDTNKAGIDEDEDGYEDDEDYVDDGGILPDDEDEENDGDDGGTLPDDDEDEEDNGESLLDDDEEGDGDEDVWQDEVLPDDDEEDPQDGVLPDDDEEDSQGVTFSEGLASEEETSGISLEDEDDSGELPEDEDEDDSWELPADEDEDDSGELPADEDEDDSGELPADEDEDAYGSEELPADEDEDEDDYEDKDDSGKLPADEDEDDYEDEDASEELPEDDVEEAPESTEEHIEPAPSRITPAVAEKPVSSTSRRRKIARPVSNQSAGRPAGYSTPSVSLYDFILSNGGSMLIEDVKKYYPIDEVKKALNLGRIYRFGNKVGV